jgi:hypothetical protein
MVTLFLIELAIAIVVAVVVAADMAHNGRPFLGD